jgi:hypothetical protein
VSQELAISLRSVVTADWPRILQLANLSVAHFPEAPEQSEWLGHRMAFAGYQRHVAAERGDEVVGYAAIERRSEDPEAAYRVFVVASWSDKTDVAEVLFNWAAAELARSGAQHAWLREYASDQPFISFLRGKGFAAGEEYEHGGHRLVTLTKELGNSALAD